MPIGFNITFAHSTGDFLKKLSAVAQYCKVQLYAMIQIISGDVIALSCFAGMNKYTNYLLPDDDIFKNILHFTESTCFSPQYCVL